MPENPFTYGNPVSDPKHFIGRQHEVRTIFSRLRNPQFESTSLVGERRIGKTSLLQYVANPEVRVARGLDLNKYVFVYINLQMVSLSMNPNQLWKRILLQISRTIENPDIQRLIETTRSIDQIDAFTLLDLFYDLQRADKRVVILLDEFEHITENPNFFPEFLNVLRSLIIHYSHNPAFVTTSRKTLKDPSKSNSGTSSPFFNPFATIQIQPFSEGEARTLISQGLDGTGMHFTEEELAAIFHIAGYHPFFLQIAGYFLFESYIDGRTSEARLSWLRDRFIDEAESHFAYYWDKSDDREKIVLTALALLERRRRVNDLTYSRVDMQETYSHSEQTLSDLQRRALVQTKDDQYLLFSSMFGEWIVGELTDTLQDRQEYESWLQSHQSIMKSLEKNVKEEMDMILPNVSGKYRQLIIDWASDPKHWLQMAGLIKSALGWGP